MNNYNAAQYWVGQGISVIPCGYRSKKPDFGALARVGSKDKNGRAMWQTYIDRLPTKEELKSWFSTRWRNVAVVTGWQNLVVIDFDQIAVYELWSYWLEAAGKQVASYKVRTPRGIHIYLFMREPPVRGIKLNGLDIKAAGGYCLADPSIHPSGTQYKAERSAIATVDSLESVLPCMWLSEAERQMQTITVQPPGPFDVIPDGAANSIKARYRVLDFFPDARLSSVDGRWYKTVCPLHDDHEASGWIDTTRNRYGCHTCIQGSIDVIDLYARLNGIDTVQVIKEMI